MKWLFGNLLQAASPWLLQLIPGRGTLYLVLAAAVAGFGGGIYVTKKFWDASELIAINESVAKERGATADAFSASSAHLANLRTQQEKADATIDELRNELKKMPDCRVPRAAARVLNNAAVPATSTPSARLRPPAQAAEAGAPERETPGASPDGPECRVVVETCGWNYANICNPNAIQLEDVQRWYNDLRKRYNN
jgi:hypothetical protein